MPPDADPNLGVRNRFLPALAALLAVASDRSRLEQEALEAEALRRSDLVKTALLRAVSHDLRSPLTGITTAIGALRSDTLVFSDDDRRVLLDTIAVDAERLGRLVGDLLDLSRLEAGGAEPEAEVWALDELVREAVHDLPGSDRVDVAGEGPLVNVDPVQIQRVLANFVENALKFSPPPAHVHVRITATRQEAIVRVVDQGPGLAASELERVFEPFYRSGDRPALGCRPRPCDRARVCRRERRPRLGRVATGAGGDVRPRVARRRGAGGAARMKQRILVVDDEPQILRALGTMLRGAGFDVDTAETAESALAAAAARPPAAVILDLVLPDGSGTDVCRELRTWTEAPVIVLSAVGEEREKIAALDAGADDYVTKPFSVEELLARLRAVLRRAAPDAGPVIKVGDLQIDVPGAGRHPRRGAHPADAARVRPAAGARAEPRQAVDAPDAPARGLGAVVPGRGALPARLRVASSREDRARSLTPPLRADGAGRRLPARRPQRILRKL